MERGRLVGLFGAIVPWANNIKFQGRPTKVAPCLSPEMALLAEEALTSIKTGTNFTARAQAKVSKQALRAKLSNEGP